jgi:hypothetical protein
MSAFPGSPRLLKGAIIGLDPFNPLASVIVSVQPTHDDTAVRRAFNGRRRGSRQIKGVSTERPAAGYDHAKCGGRCYRPTGTGRSFGREFGRVSSAVRLGDVALSQERAGDCRRCSGSARQHRDHPTWMTYERGFHQVIIE